MFNKLIQEAEKWVGVQEKNGDNSGPEVEMFQKAVDKRASKEPWCMGFVMYCLSQVETRERIRTRVFRSEHVMTVWHNTHESLKKTEPKPGYIMLWNYVGTTNGHAGIVTKLLPKGEVETIEGNTGPGAGVVREGDGVYRKNRSIKGGAKMKVIGFIDPFENFIPS